MLLRRLTWGSTPDVMPFPEFGPFATLFEVGNVAVPAYLVLLGLGDEQETLIAIERVEAALMEEDPRRWVDALLADRNWRPHLPAAVAFLLDRSSRLDIGSLWGAIDAGSWVTPQLVVAAYFTDPDFARNTTVRLEQIVAGAAPTGTNAPKVAASLLTAASQEPTLAAALARWRTEPKIVDLVERDAAWDRSDELVRRWQEAVRQRFSSRGVTLAPIERRSV